MISNILSMLARHATLAFAIGMALALVAPPICEAVGPTLPIWIFSMLTLSVVRTDTVALAGHIRRPARSVAVIFWMLVLSPLIVGSGLIAFIPLSESLMAPLLFYTAMPPLTAVSALALLFGIDAALAIVVLMAGSLITPLILPPMALLVLGIQIDIGVGELFVRLAALVFGSFLAGLVIRRLAGQVRINRHAGPIDGLMVIVMVLVVIAVFDGVHGPMHANPDLALALVAMAFGAVILYQIVGAVLFLPFGLRTALTAGMLSGNRNLAILAAVLGASATTEIALFVALGQLPVFLLPLIQRPLARHFGFSSS
ncbi:MAG: hypothetical protein O7C63_00615 [Alphaproteobacteria bacterium]|nr:hypothetical protein [Alphaproteobacteria bacterium]